MRTHSTSSSPTARPPGATAGADVQGRDTDSYAELWEHGRARSPPACAELGLRRGERVAIYLDKRIETVASIFGSLGRRRRRSCRSTRCSKAQQVAYILDDCSVRVLVTTAERLELLRDELAACPSVEHVVVARRRRRAPGGTSVHAVGRRSSARRRPARAATSIDVDMAAILYTSGSTGKPKGVVLSHRNLIVGAESVSQYLEQHAPTT